jgi:hypothetical protein
MKIGVKLAGILLILLLAPPLRADNEAAIRTAVEGGVNYLKNHQRGDGTWFFGGRALDAEHDVGVTSLGGLALLESGVPPLDPAVRKAAEFVRSTLRNTTATYDLSLGVLFLDRLGQAEDELLLEAASLSLAAGQSAEGGWGYTCPPAQGEDEVRRLRTLVQRKNGTKGDTSSRASPPSASADGEKGREERGRRQDTGMLRTNRRGDGLFPFGDDNSNTQFATLALWVARRHHLNVDRTLAAVEKRFRKSQNADGGWGYKTHAFQGMGSTASMTCAGLLGLAVGEGISRQAVLRTKASGRGGQGGSSMPDARQDRAVSRGFAFLGLVMERALEPQPESDFGFPVGRGGFRGGRGFGRGGPGGRSGNIRDNGLGSEYYFLWSLERVAVVYGQRAIGTKNWFGIGSQFLLRRQQGDGSWSGNLGESVDTCFALFFLRRANLAVDLTATLGGGTPPEQAVKLSAREPKKETTADPQADAEGGRNEKPARPPIADKKSIPPLSAPEKSPEPRSQAKPEPPARPALADESRKNEAAHLGDELVQASSTQQQSLLQELREGKGAAYTDALAAAVPRLTGDARTQARDALAERLGRMAAATLHDKCRDANPEVRRAAALACASKNNRTFVPDLIRLLGDPEARVWRAARVALKSLTSEDFGPAEDANLQARYDAVTRWRNWWAKSVGK